MEFNINGALDRLDNDKDILKMMISDFLETDKNIPGEFNALLEKKDLDSIRSLAHRMKGCLLSLGAETLGEKFKDLERGIKAHRNPYSNTVFFTRPQEKIVKKYAMACNDDPVFGKLAHVVAMQYFTPEFVKTIADDIASNS